MIAALASFVRACAALVFVVPAAVVIIFVRYHLHNATHAACINVCMTQRKGRTRKTPRKNRERERCVLYGQRITK